MFWFAADALNFGGGLVNFSARNRTARKSDWSKAVSCLRRAQRQNVTQFPAGNGVGNFRRERNNKVKTGAG